MCQLIDQSRGSLVITSLSIRPIYFISSDVIDIRCVLKPLTYSRILYLIMVFLEHSMDTDEKDGTCSDVGVGRVVRHCLSFLDGLEMFFGERPLTCTHALLMRS